MVNELQTKLDAIKLDKDTNLLPENLKKDITCLGITGTMESDIDTSDATATANDIVSGKTAYAKGEKLTGTYVKPNLQPIYRESTTYLNISAPAHPTLKIIPANLRILDRYALATFYQTHPFYPEYNSDIKYALYYLNNNNTWDCIWTIGWDTDIAGTRLDSFALVKYDENSVYMLLNDNDVNMNLYKYNLKSKTLEKVSNYSEDVLHYYGLQYAFTTNTNAVMFIDNFKVPSNGTSTTMYFIDTTTGQNKTTPTGNTGYRAGFMYNLKYQPYYYTSYLSSGERMLVLDWENAALTILKDSTMLYVDEFINKSNTKLMYNQNLYNFVDGVVGDVICTQAETGLPDVNISWLGANYYITAEGGNENQVYTFDESTNTFTQVLSLDNNWHHANYNTMWNSSTNKLYMFGLQEQYGYIIDGKTYVINE